MVRVIEAKLFNIHFLKGNDNYLQLAGVSSYKSSSYGESTVLPLLYGQTIVLFSFTF